MEGVFCPSPALIALLLMRRGDTEFFGDRILDEKGKLLCQFTPHRE
jgi:hypothetical protein